MRPLNAGDFLESQLVSFPAACGELYLAMNVSLRSKHQAPKREAFGCRDAPPRFIRGRRSRGLAPGWQTKGADIHFQNALGGGESSLDALESAGYSTVSKR